VGTRHHHIYRGNTIKFGQSFATKSGERLGIDMAIGGRFEMASADFSLGQWSAVA
jgi:hypothetical protein